MSASTPAVDIALGDVARLEDVVDREALAEVCRSFFGLFGISIRIFSKDDGLLADVHQERLICAYLNGLPGGRAACAATVNAVKSLDARDGVLVHPCFTGAVYRMVPITYQGRVIGRFVLGPYLPAETREVPSTLLSIDPGVDRGKAREALAEMPRVRDETAERIAEHLANVIGLILFSGHRAFLTSEMHVASVRESYRELAEKTASLQEAYDKLKELDRLKSNFLATVSHELRTPLTSIIGYSEMLEGGLAGALSSEQQEFVTTIRQKGDQLLALITSLLDMSKLERGRLSIARQPVDAAALVDEVVTTVTPTARRKGVTLDVHVDSALPTLSADPIRLRQVLINLTDNAIKFTPSGGHVELGARATTMGDDGGGSRLGLALMAAPTRAIALTVRDTGIGMNTAELPRIFDAFYQVDGSSTREHGGAGLGLSIVKRLVEAHGGTIEVESKTGEGTTFTVTVPAGDGAGG